MSSNGEHKICHNCSSAPCCPARKKKPEWTVRASDMARNTHNPIRKIVDNMKISPNPAKPMIALSIGDPAVFGNLPPAKEMLQAVMDAATSGQFNGYAPATGYEKTRDAIAANLSRPEAILTAKDVVLASGCSGALDMCISALGNPGDNMLLPRPGFSIYKTLANSLGIDVRFYDLLPDKDWEVDVAHLESLIDDNTVAIVLNNPSNPCGSVYGREHLIEILDVAERNKVPIIADEVYADCVFPPQEFIPLATLTTEVPVLACGGLTKKFLVPGWRFGWICIHDRHNVLQHEVRPALNSLATRILGPNTLIQGAVEAIFNTTPPAFFTNCLNVMHENAIIAFSIFSKISGLKPVMPKGAMYMMVGIDMGCYPEFSDDVEFTEALVSEQSVFCLPAKCFEYPNYFRIVLSVPQDKMATACERIHEFCLKHYNPKAVR